MSTTVPRPSWRRLNPPRCSSALRGGSRPLADTVGVPEVVHAVELDLDVLHLVLVLVLVVHGLEDGNAADREGRAAGDLGEGGGPDDGDLVAVPGADLDYDQGNVIGLFGGGRKTFSLAFFFPRCGKKGKKKKK